MIPAILIDSAVGSLPIGYQVAQSAGGMDLRRAGTGTVGAAKVYRTAGLAIAVAGMIAAMLALFRHRGHILRLLSGTEQTRGA